MLGRKSLPGRGSEVIGSVEEYARLCESEAEDDYLRLTNDQAPTFVWEEIIRKRPELAEFVVNSNTVPDSILEEIATSAPWRGRYLVAGLRRCPPYLLTKLAGDDDARVRLAVVANVSTPLKTLGELKDDEDPEVSDAAAAAWEERAARRAGRHSAVGDPVWEAAEPPAEPTESEIGKYQSYFDRLVAQYGLTSEHVVRGFDPRDPALPLPPSGPWVVVPWGDEHAVGSMRGEEFTAYSVEPSLPEAIALVARLVNQKPPVQVAPEDAQERGRITGMAIEARTVARDGRPGPNELAPGNLLDTFDDDRTHYLYALGTPFINRGLPLEARNNPYHAYEVLAPMPMAVMEGIVAPVGDLPGGGAIVVLDKPLRWYLDNGYLIEVR